MMFARMITALFILTATLQALPVYIGTNTGGESKGIYLADFDPATGKLSEPALAAAYQNPGFLALHPTKPVLLSVGAPKKPFADGTGSVAAFAIADDHSLKFLGEASIGSRGGCHLAVDVTGGTVAVASYGDGRISAVRLDENWVPQEKVSVISNEGSGPDKSRQEGPHAHGVYFDKTNTRLFVPDLGLDKVLVYPFDAETSRLGSPMPPLLTAPGGKWLLCAHQGSNTVSVLPLDPETGTLGEAAWTVASPSPICLLFPGGS
jgi:6-phosphogluconolactonase